MSSQDDYNAWQAEAAKLPGLITASDPTALTNEINTGLNNNKDITDAQARANEAAIQTQSYYNNANNPELMGLDVSSRMRLGDINSSTDRMNSQMLGAYAASRKGSVADAITAWKEAQAIKLKAAQEAADNLKAKYQASYQREQDAIQNSKGSGTGSSPSGDDYKRLAATMLQAKYNEGKAKFAKSGQKEPAWYRESVGEEVAQSMPWLRTYSMGDQWSGGVKDETKTKGLLYEIYGDNGGWY